MTTYALDIGFTSTATAQNPSQAMAAAYAFAKDSGKGWSSCGQRPNAKAMRLKPNDGLYLSFFDSANAATEVSSIQVTFAMGELGHDGQAANPFGSWSNPSSPLSLNSDAVSAGLDWAQCRGASIGPFAVNNEGDWEITISFNAAGKSFSVDPEMEVKVG